MADGLGKMWNPATSRFESDDLKYNSEFDRSFGITEDMWNSYSAPEQQGVLNSATDLGYQANIAPTNTAPTNGLGDWFSQNKDMVAGGIGLGQLGLGILNYGQNKKALESDLASAEQARRLNEEAAQNKRTIQTKTQSALRFA